MIIERYFDNGINFSSNINEGIKAVLFFYEKTPHTQKAQKALKSVNKQHLLRCFLYTQKA